MQKFSKSIRTVVIVLLLLALAAGVVASGIKVRDLKLSNLYGQNFRKSSTYSWKETSDLTTLLVVLDDTAVENRELKYLDVLVMLNYQPVNKKVTLFAFDPTINVTLDGVNYQFREVYNYYVVKKQLTGASFDPWEESVYTIETELGIRFNRYLAVNKSDLDNVLSPLAPNEEELFQARDSSLTIEKRLKAQTDLIEKYGIESKSLFTVVRGLVSLWSEGNIGNLVQTDFSVPELSNLYFALRDLNPENYRKVAMKSTSEEVELRNGAKFLRYTYIDRQFADLLNNKDRKIEQARIDIVNASSRQGLASKTARLLRNHGLDVVKLSNATDVYINHTVYVAAPEKYPLTLALLKELFPDLKVIAQEFPFRPSGELVLVVI